MSTTSWRPRRAGRAAAVASVALLLLGCSDDGDGEPTPGLANPASVHCEEEGGRVDIRQDADGGEVGICVFPDGSECEEWAFYRGECEPGGS